MRKREREREKGTRARERERVINEDDFLKVYRGDSNWHPQPSRENLDNTPERERERERERKREGPRVREARLIYTFSQQR